MRRCPYCHSPSPDQALSCAACGRALVLPRPALGDDASKGMSWRSLRRVSLALLPVLLLRLCFGSWLTVGTQRQEWHFAVYHLVHGLIFGGCLAWAWREKPNAWVLWLVAGLWGGLITEAFEICYLYHGLLGYFSLLAWKWFGLADDRALIYEILQALRLLGPALSLGLVFFLKPASRARRSLVFLWIPLALLLRSQVRGAWLAWPVLGSWMSLRQWGLYFVSALFLAWGFGPRDLTTGPKIL